MNRLTRYLIVLIGIFSFQAYAQEINLSVLVLYNSSFERDIGDPRGYLINKFAMANKAYSNSRMNLRLSLSHFQRLDLSNGNYVSDALLGELVDSESVMQIRDSVRPDIVVYFTKPSSSLCGKALFPKPTIPPGRTPATPDNVKSLAHAVSAVGYTCDDTVFPHEVGHNLGAGHGPVDDEGDILGLISYSIDKHEGYPIKSSQGHGYYNIYRTIMAYPDKFGSAPRIFYFSNPDIYVQGLPTGTGSRNNAAGMIEIATKVIQHNSECFPRKAITTKNKWGKTTTHLATCK